MDSMKAYITVGTQDKQFIRLLEYAEKLILENVITKAYIQIGQTKYDFKEEIIKNSEIEIFKFRSSDDINTIISNVDIVISHSGVGTIMDTIKKKKKIVLVPRLFKNKEHINDHQLEIAEEFQKKEYVLVANNYDELKNILKNKEKYSLKEFNSNSENFVLKLEEYIDNL